MLMKNTADREVIVEDLGLRVPAGGLVEVKDGYCASRKSNNGAPIKSIIEMLAPQLVPADEKVVAAWKARTLDLQAPPPPAPTAKDLQAQGLPPAVAAMVASGEADSVTKANKAAAQASAAPKAPATK